MFRTIMLRASPAIALAVVAFTHLDASAASPPDMPLPPCVEVNGVRQGACGQTSPDVTGTSSGKLVAGGSVTITTQPTNGVCSEHIGHGPDYPWTPSPCYSGVSTPRALTCAFIDLADGGRFRELPCSQALYKNSSAAASPMFSFINQNGGEGWQARGDFYTYIMGGPANVPGARWVDYGAEWLTCEMRFNGTRPDGLYGPTWVRLSVGIEQAQTGDVRTGYSRTANIYVPIDGDMREFVDVELLATSVVQGRGDDITITYTATLTNRGNLAAEGVEVLVSLPKQVHFKSASNGQCTHTNQFVGGDVRCRGLSLAGAEDAMGGEVELIDIVTRLTNASDLVPHVKMTAFVPNDVNVQDNESWAHVNLTLRSGTIAETREAMKVLDPYFDYQTPDELLGTQCNQYMDDIYARFQAIHAQAPEVFENLSYGKVTSGDYYWAPIENSITRAGHVGVVVYPKGTNYHETGIIVHGTPTWSPADADEQTQRGRREVGGHTDGGFLQGTQDHGWYYRTPVDRFPGSPIVQGTEGCAFEGLYPDNIDDFLNPLVKDCGAEVLPPSCPAFPDAVTVRTQSPVDILATNSKGQRVETRGGQVFVQELDTGIHSFSTPHEDGTFGWLLVLPEDDYDIQLLGTGEGPYKLTLTRFDDDGSPIEEVREGTTTPGQVDDYEFAGASSQPPGGGAGDGAGGGDGGGNGAGNGGAGSGANNGGGTGASPPGRKSGGGSFGVLSLLALLPLLVRRRRVAH